MKFRALRGVCIGVGLHLSAGDTADLDAATGQFLLSIKAVEKYDEPVKSDPTKSVPETDTKSAPEKSGKKEK